MDSHFKIVSFFTIDTPYQDVAHKFLLPSLARLGIHSDVRGVDNLGSWQKNTSFKAKYLQYMLNLHTENIVFIDCDAEVIEYPRLFEQIPENYNFAAHILDRSAWYNRTGMGEEFLSGTLFIRNCDRSKEIIRLWVNECENSVQWEQRLLKKVLEENSEWVYNLPVEYCYIATLPDGREPFVKVDKPFILHHQASRKLKHLIN